MLYYIVLCYIILYYIILYDIISYYNILYCCIEEHHFIVRVGDISTLRTEMRCHTTSVKYFEHILNMF